MSTLKLNRASAREPSLLEYFNDLYERASSEVGSEFFFKAQGLAKAAAKGLAVRNPWKATELIKGQWYTFYLPESIKELNLRQDTRFLFYKDEYNETNILAELYPRSVTPYRVMEVSIKSLKRRYVYENYQELSDRIKLIIA